MHPKAIAAGVVLVWAIGFSTQAACAGLSDLPPDQQRMAICMLSALSKVAGVSDQRLRFSADSSAAAPPAASVHTFIDYTYHHRDPGISPRIGPEELEITDIISDTKPGIASGVMLGGLVPPSGDLNDADAGMLRIFDLWRSQCGYEGFVATG